jgi:Zn-dependent protease with chaperone function
MRTDETFTQTIEVKRWPSEKPLFILVLLCSALLWILLAATVFGILYAALIGLFFFVSHVAFITHLRGSAVRLGPDQMPALHERVVQISRQIGLRKTPDVYVMQAGGTLNALATKLFSTNFIVLYADLLEACGENTAARDMIIAHELGHLKAGHLRGIWFLLPGLAVPFLGSAYSRAREYTSDRYGFSICQDRQSALVGLAILAAGGKLGPAVNLHHLAGQAKDLNTVWMTIGRWFATHPPLADRLVAIEPTLVPERISRVRGRVGALALMASVVVVPVVLGITFGSVLVSAIKQFKPAQVSSAPVAADAAPMPAPGMAAEEIAQATAQAWRDMASLGEAIDAYHSQTGNLPANPEGAYAAWTLMHPDEESLLDPFDGFEYGYQRVDDSYVIWSEGPSADTHTDNLIYKPTVQ